MSLFQNLTKAFGYIVNPAGYLIDKINNANQPSTVPGQPDYVAPHGSSGESPGWWNQFKNWLSGIWDDVTGKSQIEMENQMQKDLMDYKYQKDLDAIGDTADAYEQSGFNRNMLYGSASPVSYQTPNLQAYSGSARIDKILQNTGKVLNLIPALYQSTAALEGIDQAREKTKQSEIKTMAMGMSLLDNAYKFGDTALSHPFTMDLNGLEGGKRHWLHISDPVQLHLFKPYALHRSDNYDFEFSRYADAVLKQKFDLLDSIGIKNSMNQTLNNWRGYQYGLDKRFGAAGRIVGMGAQGLGAVAKFFSPIKFGQ